MNAFARSCVRISHIRRDAVCCSVLPCVAVCCSVLQHVLNHDSGRTILIQEDTIRSLLQSVAVCCSVLPCVAVCCRVLLYVAVCGSVL